MKAALIWMLVMFLATLVAPATAAEIVFSDGFEDPGSANHAPAIVSAPVTSATVGMTYHYDVDALDEDGDVLEYRLDIAPDAMSMDAATGLITWLPETSDSGNHQITVAVTDGLGGQAHQEYTLFVVAADGNQPPVADAGADQTLVLGTTAYLDGSASNDPDGNIEGFHWHQYSGAYVILEQPDNAVVSFQATTTGVYEFELEVRDDQGAVGTDQVRINVEPVGGNQPPVAEAGDDRSVVEQTRHLLDGTGSQDSDGQGSIARYLWEQLSGPAVTLENGGAYSDAVLPVLLPAVTTDTPLVFKLTVWDEFGATGTDTVTLTVVPAMPPSADAGNDREIVEGLDIELNAYASLPGRGGEIPWDGVDWKQVSGPPVTLRFRDYRRVISFTAPQVSVNTLLAFELKVTNEWGETDTDIVNVLVKDESNNSAPVADAGPDREYPNPLTSIPLDATASFDPDGNIESYEWTIQEPSGFIFSFSRPYPHEDIYAMQAGVFTITLKVTDNNGAMSSSTVHYTIHPQPGNGNQLPDANVQLSGRTLDGSGSSDADGNIVGYHWYQTGGETIILEDAEAVASGVSWECRERRIGNLSHSFTLLVEDDRGGMDAARLTFTRRADDCSIFQPYAILDFPWLVLSGSTVVLDGSLSTDEDTKGYLIYEWGQVSGPAIDFQGQNNARIIVQTPAVTGLSRASITLKVTDITDRYRTSNKIMSIVSADHESDGVDAGNDQWVLPGERVDLVGQPLMEGRNSRWIQLSGPRVEMTGDHDWHGWFKAPMVAAETELLFALADVSYSVGQPDYVRYADVVKVTVTPAPVALAGTDQMVLENDTVILDGNASSGDNLQFQWRQLSGPVVALEGDRIATATFIAPPVAADTVLVFELEVADARGVTASDTVNIVVQPDLHDGDRDADGVPDEHDAFPDDPSDAYDFDADGYGDNNDLDRDGDGVDNGADFYPDDPARFQAPALVIDEPQPDEQIDDETVLVKGSLIAPWNTGILINGEPALRGGSPWGSTFALRLPLASGNNEIQILVTGQSGRQISRTLNVSRTGSAPFHLQAAPRRAFAPGQVSFFPSIPDDLDIVKAEWDFDGDGNADLILNDGFNESLTHTYATEGLYYPSLVLTDVDGITYSQRLVLSMIDQTAQENRLKSLWADMLAALNAGNLGLSQSFVPDDENGYGNVFHLLLPYMPGIVSGFTALETLETALDRADFGVGSTANGEARVFVVQMMKNLFGVWKVVGM